jgi:PIN domain nuclease of toxin-antitoxin system
VNCLLDTHSFLWSAFEPGKLSRTACQSLTDIENTVYVSAVTFWEISLKLALGKLSLRNTTPEQLPAAATRMGFVLLPLTSEEASTFHRLPRREHKDPFDRMLVWQAIQRNLVLVSVDSGLNDYGAQGLTLLW